MVDERLKSMGNVRFRFHAENAFANMAWPLVSELNAGQELEQVTLWDNFEVGAQASETSDAVPIGAKANVVRRGGANYGGTASFWYPGYRSDMSNAAALVYLAFKNLHTPGYISLSVDGEIGEPGQPLANMQYGPGEYVSIMKVVTDEWTDSITGEDAFYYTRNFLKAGGFAPYTVSGTTVPAVVVTSSATTGAPASNVFVTAKINGRDWTRGVAWSTSDPTKATVSATGVVKLIAAGSVTITATVPRTTASTTATAAITIA